MGRTKDAEATASTTSHRPVKAVESVSSRFNWPWELTVDIGNLDPPKIAFLSGHDREYFPEHPGHTRHGIEYSMNCAPGDVPNPSYYPPQDRMYGRPVSRRGYGIGGLSALRFPREPWNKIIKIPRRRTLDGPIEPPRPRKLPPDPVALAKKAAAEEERQLLKKLCSPIAFGTTKDAPRFGKKQKWSSVGVGHYDFAFPELCKKPRVLTMFGFGPSTLVPTTVTECTYENLPCCCECENDQGYRDYYKSVRPVALPIIRFFLSEADKNPKLPKKKNSKGEDETEYHRPALVVICRKCFCRVMREGHTFWRKVDLVTKFQKTRHCIHIHHHNNLPNVIHKVPCKLVRDLSRKEALMGKYFNDSCPKVVKEHNSPYSRSTKKPKYGKLLPIN